MRSLTIEKWQHSDPFNMIKRHSTIQLRKPSDRSRRIPSADKSSVRLRLSPKELYAEGKRLRDKFPRQSHADWQLPHDRPDPISLLKQSSHGRIPKLIPLRYGRMLQSPFTFYRGAALNMAADLSHTPVTGLRVQACGDCHLLNFGLFATPERREIFDINDLDETLPAPWEWDVKRLAASFVLACRNNGLGDGVARDIAMACVRSYRHHMAEFGEMSVLDVWYASIDVEDMIPGIKDDQTRKRFQKRLAAARRDSTHEHHFPALEQVAGRGPTIEDNPPLIFHWRQRGNEEFFKQTQAAFVAYRKTLENDRRVLLDRYELKDVAIKVVGVGSVGTRCGVALLLAGEEDSLFLQIKEAGASVLEPYAGKSLFPNHGQRVVNGCHLMQSASDLFLGWLVGPKGRHFYVRQLRDMKIKILVEVFNHSTMEQYAKLCGWTLARAHARSGEPAKISGYLGRGDKFDQAVADFSIAYADQSERDHKVLLKAVRDGKIEVSE
jgi:uncharacterized protein (DUF2252 family)